MFPGLEGGGGRGRAGGVPAQLDVSLHGFDVVYHHAELVDEADQGHVDMLADGLAGDGEVAVEGAVVALAEVVEGEHAGCALRGAHRPLYHHRADAEGLQTSAPA